MCGIAGVVNWSGEPLDRALLARMIDVIDHRGPDAQRLYIDGKVGLAHARLSIIDLEGGSQPMANEDQTCWVTFNGEIFNYLELREDLEARGHRFATRSDTEVILHAYEEFGERCVDEFNGQWAFAIWDARHQRLFLSRDRMGVRPLFYTHIHGSYLFASEIKALFRHGGVRRELDLCGLDETFTFWAPLAPRTPFAGICELPPGHSMVVSATAARTERYWTPEYFQRGAVGKLKHENEYRDELLALLTDATRIRLRSDVPVGAYLSGGLDSTLVTSLIKRCSTARLKTFSMTFDEAEYDESTHQREAVRFLDTDHCTFHCSAADLGRAFPDVVWHAEKALLRTGPAPFFLLSAKVREQGYKVVLTGEGADETLGGYDLFKEAKIRRFWARAPESCRRPLLLKRLYPYLPQIQAQSPEYLKAFFGVRPEDCGSPFFSHLPRWNMTSGLKRFFSPDVKAKLAGFDGLATLESTLPQKYREWDDFSQAQYLEASGLLPAYILSSQGDRVAMAHAVEGRFPFLDHRVVAFAAALPPQMKMKVLEEKTLLKCAADGLVPDSVRRRKKQPYRAPESKSFFGVPDRPRRHDYVDDALAANRVRDYGVFAPEAVQGLLKKARAGQLVSARDNMALVGILSTQLLIQQFICTFTG